jgi:hypothetical protein
MAAPLAPCILGVAIPELFQVVRACGGEIVSSGLEELAFTPPDDFRPPRWLRKEERKHIPERNWTWEQVVEKSMGREGDAWYHPRHSHDRIQELEMGTLRDRFEIKPKRKSHLRAYCRFVGEIIGVSKGKPTEYIYVTYGQEGGGHGFPIRLEELRAKGAEI